MRVRSAFLVIAAIVSAACGGDGYYAMGDVSSTGGTTDGGGNAVAGAVTVGTGIQFVSAHNASMNPAVDTITAGSSVTWTWKGTLPHNVRSTGTPSFTSSEILTGSGSYVSTFTTPGTYRYDCVVHGQAMTGIIVVLPAPGQSSAGAGHDRTPTSASSALESGNE